jgi:FG-GAP-like repeat
VLKPTRRWGGRALRWGGGAAGLACVIAAGAASAPVSFAPVVNVAIGGRSGCTPDVDCSDGPIAVAAGDFNHDGKLDVATANYISDDVTVLLGDGQGGLSASLTLDAPSGPTAIASGNLNSDAFPDLVVAKDLSNNIGVFLAKSDGTFQPQVEYDMGSSPEALVLADFDGNGTLDVATADNFSDTISVRLGNGDGTFGALKQTQVPGGPNGLAAGMLDAGDTVDLVVSLQDVSALATLLGNGDGTFAYAGTASAAVVDDSPRGVVLADFNHDGKLDAAVATESLDEVDVLLGNGDGTFQPETSYTVGGFPEAVVAADFNGDGILDLASADSFGTDELDASVSVLLGNGNGTFQAAQQFGVDLGPWGLVAVDLNGDRLPDLVTANQDSSPPTISILKNTGAPPAPACVGDCSGDGMVSINELITGVNIVLGSTPVASCPAFDAKGDGTVTITELITAVNNALNGCPVG